MFKKKSLVSKLWLKYTNRNQYKQYKWELKNYGLHEISSYLTGNDRLNSLEKIVEFCSTNNELNINHSGNIGDIIYALPTIKRIYELTGVNINLYLKLGQPRILPQYMSHPLGSIMLNQKMVDMLSPLIDSQAYIKKCEVYNGQFIHIDLDIFHSQAIPLDKANIARWCGYITGVTPQLWKNWITVTPNTNYENKIVIARSGRYRNSSIDYSFLKKYGNLIFIGVASEYEDLCKYVPNVQWVQVKDFLELTQIIAGCKFFIGNQSFPFAIAEGLKVPRILEAYYEIPNVIPEGENAYDFFFQEHFESLVSQLSAVNYTAIK
ncbi:MAG TPA: hypothetical protein VNX40_12065 [Mucilaginibacter sp.]|jgi:hypothetical protein|nr:hypothetical protein [Mucilaginibacter sp.]